MVGPEFKEVVTITDVFKSVLLAETGNPGPEFKEEVMLTGVLVQEVDVGICSAAETKGN